ncbi:hypothetical protein [Planctomycetes bacterium Poly30]
MNLRRAFAGPLLLFAAPPLLAGDVWTIAGDGSGDFTSIEAAYTAAADGDVLHVTFRPLGGNFLSFDGKGVVIINDDVGLWQPYQVTLSHLPAGSRFVVRGLSVRFRLSVESCAGDVIVSDATADRAMVVDSASVTIRRVMLSGYAALGHGLDGAIGILDSNVILEDCVLRGTHGQDGQTGGGICTSCCTDGEAGKFAMDAQGVSLVRVQSTDLIGGSGGIGGGNGACSNGLDAGAYRVGPGVDLTLVDTLLVSPGASVGTATVLPDTARRAVFPGSVASGEPIQVRLTGAPGDTAFALLDGRMTFDPISSVTGVLQVTHSSRRVRLGTLPPGGVLTATLGARMAADGTAEHIPLQVILVDGAGVARCAPGDLLAVRGAGVQAW